MTGLTLTGLTLTGLTLTGLTLTGLTLTQNRREKKRHFFCTILVVYLARRHIYGVFHP